MDIKEENEMLKEIIYNFYMREKRYKECDELQYLIEQKSEKIKFLNMTVNATNLLLITLFVTRLKI